MAQASGGVTSFKQGDESWRRQQTSSEPITIIQNYINDTGPSGIRNITEAEQAFCYEVKAMPNNFDGYTMNNTAVTGFCGVLNKELKEMIIQQLFATESNVSFTESENCMVNPRLILRFVRGIDYTDVMLSSPCHSIAIFYAGGVKAYNFKPSQALIDTIIDAFYSNRIDFVSPALLNQLLPVGIVQNEEHRRMVEKKVVAEPVRNWDRETPKAEETKSQPSGWNNLPL
jgi:hypothetical protein